jgi:glutamyl-tRNA synthetase
MIAGKPARTRFAPSPTGSLHLGGARTALYDYLLARQTGGQFILRLEDTDQTRFIPESVEEIARSLRWLGLPWDEGYDIGGPYGPYRQSERRDIYLTYARKLIEQGDAYYCFCSPDRLERVRHEQQKLKQQSRYDGTCRILDPDEADRRVARGEKYVIRFKMPKDGSTTVNDLMRGDITVENTNLDDSILVRSDGLATYHLSAMADDFDMKITHVFRGAEWLPSFPLHTRIIKALNWPLPEFAHLSVFLKPSGKGKMSKRESPDILKDGYSIFIKDLQDLGYLPEATVNWIALMGWSFDDRTEYFTLSDLVEKFNLQKLNPAPAAINFTKFDHFNGLHIRHLAPNDLADRVKPFFTAAGYEVDDDKLKKVIPLIQQRIGTLDDAPSMAGFFFKDEVTPEPEHLVGKKMTSAESLQVAKHVLALLENQQDVLHIHIEPILRNYVENACLSAGQVFGIMRVAVTGQTVSPPLFESMEIIGREVVLERMRKAIAILEAIS